MSAGEIMTAVLFFLTAFGALSGLWWRVESKIKAVEDKAHEARDELAAHKLHVAETYVTKAGMQEQTLALTRMIDSIGDKIDKINERLDRVIEQKPTRRS